MARRPVAASDEYNPFADSGSLRIDDRCHGTPEIGNRLRVVTEVEPVPTIPVTREDAASSACLPDQGQE